MVKRAVSPIDVFLVVAVVADAVIAWKSTGSCEARQEIVHCPKVAGLLCA